MADSQTNSKTIFFVDDEAIIRKAIVPTLEQLELDIRCFEGAKSCLKAVKNSDCSLLITDINMPEMNGVELIRKAREHNPQLPIIAITGYGDIPMAVNAMKAGAIDFIEKPLDEEVFLSAIRKALRINSPENVKNVAGLTAAEQGVLSYVVSGKTNKEIAQLLNRSIRTIENHRHRLSKKLGCNNTADLVKAAIRLGISKVEEI